MRTSKASLRSWDAMMARAFSSAAESGLGAMTLAIRSTLASPMHKAKTQAPSSARSARGDCGSSVICSQEPLPMSSIPNAKTNSPAAANRVVKIAAAIGVETGSWRIEAWRSNCRRAASSDTSRTASNAALR